VVEVATTVAAVAALVEVEALPLAETAVLARPVETCAVVVV
jgi:uncharacterized membrane protein